MYRFTAIRSRSYLRPHDHDAAPQFVGNLLLAGTSLRQPAGEPAKPIHQALAKDQNAARRQFCPSNDIARAFVISRDIAGTGGAFRI
jgi:hypothetical protein